MACTAFVVTTSCGSGASESSTADSSAVASKTGHGVPGAAGAPVVDSGPAAPVQPGEDVLTADGWGELRIGMTRAQVVAAAGDDAAPGNVGGPDPESCDLFRPSRAPAGLLVMVEDGILTRISVSGNAGLSTPEGIRVGDEGSAVLAAYGSRAVVAPHKYWESPAGYITVWRSAPGERRGIRYEIDTDGKVVHIHAGSRSIEYVEGCL